MTDNPVRIYIDEFLFTSGLSAMQKAGFKAFVGNVKWAYRQEWEELLYSYNNR